jgi:type IV secretion system protein VirD4
MQDKQNKQKKQNNKVAFKNHFYEFIRSEEYSGIILGIVIVLALYVAGCIYALLLGFGIHNITPFSWAIYFINEIKNMAITHNDQHFGSFSSFAALIISGSIPALLIAYYYFVYKKIPELAVKWLIVGAMLFLFWSWISSVALLSFVNGHITQASPLAYIQTLILLDTTHIHYYLIVSAGIGLFSVAILSLFFIKDPTPIVYGDAHFASFAEIRKAGFYIKSLKENSLKESSESSKKAGRGILLGKAYGNYLCMGGFEHVTLFSPSGSFKTVSLTIPNLLNWSGSCVVSDVKLTLFEQTSAYRASIGQKVFLFNPASPTGITHCYNPLSVIIDSNRFTRIDEIQKIASIFIPDNPKSEPIWQVQSRMLFVALVLYILDTPGIEKNIYEVIKIIKSQKSFTVFINEEILTRENLDIVCVQNLMKFVELHDKTRQSILATFLSYFELFDNPLVVAATSKSDFDLRNLRNEAMTIYVGVTNDNLVRLSPLLTIFYQQVTDVLTRKVPGPDEPYGVLLFMDEFATLRRMETFSKNIGLFREYRVRVIIIIQELSQLYEIYGRDGARVFINAKVRIAFTQNDEESCKLIESMLGNKTVRIKNTSKRAAVNMLNNDNDTESHHYTGRPLMSAQEIRVIPEDEEIIFIQGQAPIYAKKILWFKDKNFTEKVQGKIEVKSILSYLETDDFKKEHVKPVDISEKKEKQISIDDLNQVKKQKDQEYKTTEYVIDEEGRDFDDNA